MKRMINSFVAVLFVVSLAGCQSMTGKTAGQNVDDATLTTRVKTKLVSEKAAIVPLFEAARTLPVTVPNPVYGLFDVPKAEGLMTSAPK